MACIRSVTCCSFQRLLVFDMIGTRTGTGRQQRNNAGTSEHHGFLEKFLAVEQFGIGPIPVAPQNRSEGSLPFRHDEISGHAAASGAGVGNVMHGDIAAMLDGGFRDVEWRFLVLFKDVRASGVLPVQRRGGKKKEGCTYKTHRQTPWAPL
jgi:hypothetical protein